MFRKLLSKPSLARPLSSIPSLSYKTNSFTPILKSCARNSSFSFFKSFFFHKNRIKPYQFKSNDYVRLAHPKIGFCEIQGNRDAQEDVIDAAENLTGIEKTVSHDIKSIYKNTIASMQEKYGNEPDQGSTLCSVTAWIDAKHTLNSHTAYVGDSSSYLVVMNEKNEVVTSTRLNKNLHNPPDGRLILTDTLGTPVFSIRHDMVVLAKGSLALDRSIGDTAYEAVGLSHEPEIDECKISIPPRHKAYIITACDGLTEGNLKLNDIATIVAKNSAHSPDIIARELVTSAYERGSNDNISVAVMLVDSEKPMSTLICDGHGGKKVSEAIGKAFYTELKKQINHYKPRQTTIEPNKVFEESKEEKRSSSYNR